METLSSKGSWNGVELVLSSALLRNIKSSGIWIGKYGVIATL